MNMNNSELSFEIVYHGVDLIQVKVKAFNTRYAGVTTFYSNANGSELADFGLKLRRFPREIGQIVAHSFGYPADKFAELMKDNQGLNSVLSYVGLKFLCVDKLGHSAVEIDLL